MADKTKIEWADATINAINGCEVHSPGCTNCYAMRSGGRNLPGHPSTGLTKPSKAGHVWTGEVRLNEEQLLKPLRWKKPRRIFWNAHGDLFYKGVPVECVDRNMAVIALTPHHQHMVLTKRSDRMREYFYPMWDWRDRVSELIISFPEDLIGYGNEDTADYNLYNGYPLPNVWLGVSVENQDHVHRIDDLRATPAARRFVSFEPLLGLVKADLTGIYLVIAGGESGPGARPMHPDWVRSLRDQCAGQGVAFLFKQWGEWSPYSPHAGGDLRRDVETDRVRCVHPRRSAQEIFDQTGRNTERGSRYMARIGKKRAGNHLDGRQHLEFPA